MSRDKGKHAAYMKEWRAKNRERIRAQGRVTGTAYRNSHREQVMLSRVRAKTKRPGLPFDLTEDDIIIPDVCPILNIPLHCSETVGPAANSPSLDRIDPSKGYIKGNI